MRPQDPRSLDTIKTKSEGLMYPGNAVLSLNNMNNIETLLFECSFDLFSRNLLS